MSQVSIQEAPCLVSFPTNILTLQDVVLDSPVWRANVLHLQDQIDQFEKWIIDFIRALKSYIDAIHKHNTQATALCKKTFFHNLDGTLIDTKIAGNVVTRFATTLQATITYKMKMASDLEDTLLKPLQNMIKNDLKSFKDSRKQFDKMLEKYETQLYRYSLLSKQKEASALREDAFQMYELRKSYIKTSSDHFVRLVSLKANLEILLVECFSGALECHMEEMDESSAYAYHRVKSKLPGWKQWLDASKVTCDYQLNKMKKRCIELQDVYIDQTMPPRSLKRYSNTYNDQMSAVQSSNGLHESDEEPRTASPLLDPNTIGVAFKEGGKASNKAGKQGYLNSRIVVAGSNKSRPSWTRRWFFLQQGWFGTCTVTTLHKEKGCITLGDRVWMTECVFRVNIEVDRRYCFEVIHPKCCYYLQAETEEEMQQWLWTMEYNMEKHDDQIQKSIISPPQARFLSSGNNSKRESALLARTEEKAAAASSSPHLITMSSSPIPSPEGSQEDSSNNSSRPLNAIVSTTTSSLTALLINEGDTDTSADDSTMSLTTAPTQQQQDHNNNRFSQQLSAWGMPWLTTGINALSHTGSEEDLLSFSSGDKLQSSNNSSIISAAATTAQQQHLVVWPSKLEKDVQKPELSHYTNELETSQRELRRVFANVPEDEIVMESFLASYYKKSTISDDGGAIGYSGTVYVTQRNLWFYSCTLMTCIHMLVVPLENIKLIRLDNTEHGSSMMLIQVDGSCSTNQQEQQLCFGLWLTSANLKTERLKVIVENSKQQSNSNKDLQTLYDTIRNIAHTNKKVNNNKASPTSQVTTSSAALYASVTPLTVQAQQQQPMQQTVSTSTEASSLDEEEKMQIDDVASSITIKKNHHEEEEEGGGGGGVTERPRSVTPPFVHHRGSPAQGALTAVYNNAVVADKKKKNIRPSKATTTPPPLPKDDTTVEKEEQWPNDIPKPKEKVSCDCADHLEKKEVDLVLPISAKQIYQLLFFDPHIWIKLNKAKQNGEPTFSEWKKPQSEEAVLLERTITYIMPVNQPMVKTKETDVVETQQLLQKKDHLCYVVMVMTKTPNMPYADAFIPCIKYCITYVGPTSCRLVCSIGVQWLKSIFVKGMVNKAATNGMTETVNKLVPIVRQEILALTKKGKRHDNALPITRRHVPVVPPKENEAAKERSENRIKWLLNNTIWSTLFGLMCVLLMVHQFSRLGKYESNLLQHHNNMRWRGVYLRDIETEVTQKESTLDHVNPTLYQFFQDSRRTNDIWFSKHHRIMAQEFGYSRERVGAIRYELLAAFRILNKVEYQLLENEYWNWISDTKLKCIRGGNGSITNDEMCKAIELESRDA